MRYYPVICLKGLRKTTKSSVTLVSARAWIRIEHRLKTSLECYRCAYPLDFLELSLVKIETAT
jgi:hypothetical protein